MRTRSEFEANRLLAAEPAKPQYRIGFVPAARRSLLARILIALGVL